MTTNFRQQLSHNLFIFLSQRTTILIIFFPSAMRQCRRAASGKARRRSRGRRPCRPRGSRRQIAATVKTFHQIARPGSARGQAAAPPRPAPVGSRTSASLGELVRPPETERPAAPPHSVSGSMRHCGVASSALGRRRQKRNYRGVVTPRWCSGNNTHCLARIIAAVSRARWPGVRPGVAGLPPRRPPVFARSLRASGMLERTSVR